MPKPSKIITTGADSYAPKKPGEKSADYDAGDIMNQPDLPEVAPPSGGASAAAAQIAFASSGQVDPNAPDVLKLIQGTKFKTPFTVTLMKKAGQHVFKSDAGSKTEDKFELCKETIREPADLLRLNGAIKVGAYKAVNDISLELQLMMYLATECGAIA